jgi:hypothetical protein
MNKKIYFFAILMLGLFSSASFASIKADNENTDSEYLFSKDDLKGHWSSKSHESWDKAVEDYKYCDIKDDKGWGSFDNGDPESDGQNENHGEDPEDGPSSVPVPPAIWLFGSALLGLVGLKRKTGSGSSSMAL